MFAVNVVLLILSCNTDIVPKARLEVSQRGASEATPDPTLTQRNTVKLGAGGTRSTPHPVGVNAFPN